MLYKEKTVIVKTQIGLITNNKILREEVDMGQLDAMKKTPTKDAPAEVKKEIRRLRQQIDDYEQEGKDISTLQKKIQQLKDKYYN